MEIEGEFVNFSDTEGYHIIKVNEDYLLDEIDDDSIADYARWTLNMIHEDSVYSSLNDFDEDEIVSYLEDKGYDFMEKVDSIDMIEQLESEGYIVSNSEELENSSLDIIDSRMLEEIKDIFINSSVFERERIYNLITKL